jgi:hypothetical protein
MYSYSCMLYGIWTMVLPNREQISNTQLATLIHGYYCTAPCHAIYYNIGYSTETASIIVVIVLVCHAYALLLCIFLRCRYTSPKPVYCLMFFINYC